MILIFAVPASLVCSTLKAVRCTSALMGELINVSKCYSACLMGKCCGWCQDCMTHELPTDASVGLNVPLCASGHT